MGLLITTKELAVASEVIVFDCSFNLMDPDAGRIQFETAHIPGARYADLNRDLSDISRGEGRHPLPTVDDFADRLRNWGVNTDSTVVCYDQNVTAYATRLWWMVRWLGHENVFVLDGGLAAWQAAGFEVETGTETGCEPGNFEVRPALTRVCQAAELPDESKTLVDARETKRFLGEEEPIDPVAGHIPGAVCLPFTDNLEDGRFRSPEKLRARFEAQGIDNSTVCYCGSGVTATHNLFAIMLAGLAEPALYPGSWSGWITDPNRPVATGS